MVRMSKEDHEGILKEIADKTNAGPELMDLLGKLRSDFDESLVVDVSEVGKEWEDKFNSMKGERDKAIGERDEARRAYRERFFNASKEAEKIIDDKLPDSPMGIDKVLGL